MLTMCFSILQRAERMKYNWGRTKDEYVYFNLGIMQIMDILLVCYGFPLYRNYAMQTCPKLWYTVWSLFSLSMFAHVIMGYKSTANCVHFMAHCLVVMSILVAVRI